MDYFSDIYGNQTVCGLLRREAERGTLAHAYIIEGEPGSGRGTLARAALATLARDPDDAERIRTGLCPDIMYVSTVDGKVTITVDQVRTMREQAYLRPSELDFKAFLIVGAHRMNEAAQNALLKLLEEPPAQVYFFLLCDAGCRLLPTVCSRAQILHTECPDADTLDRILCERSPRASVMKRQKPEEYAFVLRSPSVGAALAALDAGKSTDGGLYAAVIALLDILRGADKRALIAYETKLPDERAGFSEFLIGTATALRDILVHKKGGGQMLFFRDEQEAADYGFSFSERALTDKINLCLAYADQNEMNINLRVAKLRLLDELWG